MDFVCLRVRKVALPIKQHIKKIQIEENPGNQNFVPHRSSSGSYNSNSLRTSVNNYLIKPAVPPSIKMC